MGVNGTLVEDKIRGFKGEWAHFSFNKCPIYTDDGASAKFSTNSQEKDNSVGGEALRWNEEERKMSARRSAEKDCWVRGTRGDFHREGRVISSM